MISSDEKIGTWVEARGRIYFCFLHKEENAEKMEGDSNTHTTYTAQTIEVKQKDIELVKAFFIEKISTLAKEKTEGAYKLLAGKDVDNTQLERYRKKLEWAKENKDALLSAEAQLAGVSVEQLKKKIITIGEAWNNTLDRFLAQIETVRVLLNALVEKEEFNKVWQVLEVAKDFGAGTTFEDIQKVLNDL